LDLQELEKRLLLMLLQKYLRISCCGGNGGEFKKQFGKLVDGLGLFYK